MKRFRKWCNLAPSKTRLLAEAVTQEIVPKLEELGFRSVEAHFWDPDFSILGREIVLEKIAGHMVDSITINFDKYRRPCFQIQGSRRESAAPYKFSRAANLVKNRSQYLYFWGKPWWLPTRLWPIDSASTTVAKVVQALEQLIFFLESGEKGSNVSK